MSKHWPPPAAVEDEITSLAREYGSSSSDSESDDDKAPPGSQGTVDQQPIILDITDAVDSPKERSLDFQRAASQKVSLSTPPPQPTQVKEEKRVSFGPASSVNTSQKTDEYLPQKPASVTPVNQDPIQRERGRPQVSRIYTNLDRDFPGSISASQQRYSSQYAWKPTATNSRDHPERNLQPSLLPPGTHAQGSQEGNPRRARSANPHPVCSDRMSAAIESSDSDTRPLRRRHRSKSRVRPRESPVEHYRSADESSFGRRERRKSQHRRSSRLSPEISQSTTAYQRVSHGHSSAHGHPTPPQTPSMTRESPHSSAAEDSAPRRTRARSRTRQPVIHHSRDSPYSSAAEESGKEHKTSEGVRDPGSIKRANKPHLELYDLGLADCPKFLSPQTIHTPRIIEDDLRRAFEENQKKLPKYMSTRSSRPSPLSSPPRSPAQTEHKSEDYFEISSPHNNAYIHKHRSRPQSTDESPIKPLTSLLTAAIGGSMSSKAIPGFPRSSPTPAEGVVCSLSKPWIRIAIARFLQNNTADISLLDSLSRLPDQTLPCPGKNSDVRKWYHITDPTTKLPIPNSDSCGACVRSAELIFPELRQQKLFERPVDKLMQERRCMLNPTSKHFYRIANELDKLAGYIRKNDLRSKDIVKFGELIKSKSRSRECQKDTMLATPLWHFIPALPQFTICEECFEEVVWPLGDKPIARDVQKTLQPVPTYLPGQQVPGVSCHLYSERMRQVFRQAVDWNDFAYLKQVALARFHTEQRSKAIHKSLMRDMASGIDRRVEVEKNIAEWKAFE
ncbi:hypothetical protein DV738_g4925, partial [Chaetothyriales sp. CBS 135597]